MPARLSYAGTPITPERTKAAPEACDRALARLAKVFANAPKPPAHIKYDLVVYENGEYRGAERCRPHDPARPSTPPARTSTDKRQEGAPALRCPQIPQRASSKLDAFRCRFEPPCASAVPSSASSHGASRSRRMRLSDGSHLWGWQLDSRMHSLYGVVDHHLKNGISLLD